MSARILIVDDEEHIRDSIAQWLELGGHLVDSASDAISALKAVRERPPDVVISDIKMPGRSGMDLLHDLRRLHEDLPVILLTAHGDIPLAVAAIRDGAHDFLPKPYSPERLSAVVARALEQGALRAKIRQLSERRVPPDELTARLVGSSTAIGRVREAVSELARFDTNVIVLGETGTGKEVVARCLHDFGARSSGPFVAINCAAMPEDLFESELFGHEAGAFTGARRMRIGKFEYANGGTLLFDEIESMPLLLQAKLLRVLQERSVERVGSNRSIPLDVRVIAATKDNLLELVAAGRFRADLYYRLSGAEIILPPLRAREGDAFVLFEHFSTLTSQVTQHPPTPLTSADIAALYGHTWPGNVRELKSVAERHSLGLKTIGRSIAEILGAPPTEAADGTTLADRVAAFERHLIETALRECGGSIARVVEHLGVPRRTLNEKMSRYGLVRPGRSDAVSSAETIL